jgi:uncharacterized protein YjbI with pentapeptide repeats
LTSVIVGAIDLTLPLVLGAIFVFAALALAAVWMIPKRQARAWERAGIKGSELAELENSARGTVVQLIGGVALILTFAATWAQIADTRRATDETLDLTAVQQENERFTRAMDQLASSRLEIRVGAITGLSGIARASASQREPVVQILLTYLHGRRRSSISYNPRPNLGPLPADLVACKGRHTTGGRVAPDTQAAMKVILANADVRRYRYNLAALDLSFLEGPSAKLSGVNLEGADLGSANLASADFADADLSSSTLDFASLARARFAKAGLSGASVKLACARGASFRSADAYRAHFQYADLSEADLSGSTFTSADLPNTNLVGASFRSADLGGADLKGAHLDGVSFVGTDLRGADLSGTTVKRAAVREARTDACTRLPWRRQVPRRCLPAGST